MATRGSRIRENGEERPQNGRGGGELSFTHTIKGWGGNAEGGGAQKVSR